MKLSLKLRLTLLFLVLSLTAWFAASLVAWQQTTHKLDKLFDTQQMLFAKRLLTMELDELHAPARMREVPKKAKHGHLDDDALAFAIYASDGTMILNDGENGRDIPYHYRRDGFDDGRLQDDNDEWRFLWLTSPDGKYRVVVGQEWEYRQDMALDVVSSQLTPWQVALPVMLLLLIVLLSRELKPLKKLAQTLRARSPDATDALPIQGVPAEVRPLLDSLNHLFARTQEMMTRERRFTSDAAHELRSPLAALKVQTDVAQLSQDDPQAQEKALTQLHAGIDRASRLVDQLLTLSRLDSLDSLDGVEQIAMADLLQSAVMDIYPPAQQAGIDIRLNINAPEVTRTGQQLLLSLLVRNLLDNATRYSPRGSVVDVTLDARRFTVRDNGPGISPDALARLGERFYRPPGQDATGSGLGLSIVKRIAALHGMHVALGNAPEGGFEVNVSW
ncbi:TPA: two-component system sensor histidine kinase QseC [Enterobacter kobei]|uniref:quorum sensing histidine kinase QseC n=1 Tax=Enterobacter TaxID=547 RepID=UPI000E413B56|nr:MULTISPECIES: quorum sensing histidine kinase QseC [Enterobacter]MBT1949735.1 two-component system sensor histidine kinase QseC [Enterobacter kobei]MCE1358154.1 two-component system sensor histidine kinase QseC [Enterobacter kobei]MCK6792116.1 two-component system sensor histidine kinase QseC [Enterobacter kobei]RGD10518.1 two-component system sensor histidine kinase QseC [Enterobacter sp. AM17-18]UKB64240.1 two-component system sensor histidine kinase QseC [Enterobacter cloacae complex sp.